MSQNKDSLEQLKAVFLTQAHYCGEMDSPFMVRLCTLIAEHLKADNPVTENMYHLARSEKFWDIALPLRIAGALHSMVLNNSCQKLQNVYPPHHLKTNDTQLWEAVEHALKFHSDYLLPFLKKAPQTNEVRRSAVLLPGFLTIANCFPTLPFILSELGASAGINQCWDKFSYTLGNQHWGDKDSPILLEPDWQGMAPPQITNIEIQNRAACDLSPVNYSDPNERLGLLSYIWADQEDRFERTDHALEIVKQHQYPIEKADISAWLPLRLSQDTSGAVHVIYHTIVWGYQDEEAQIANKKVIEDAGRKATKDAPLAWLRLEPDGNAPGAAITLTHWPGGEECCLGRADYHGRWINWTGLNT